VVKDFACTWVVVVANGHVYITNAV